MLGKLIATNPRRITLIGGVVGVNPPEMAKSFRQQELTRRAQRETSLLEDDFNDWLCAFQVLENKAWGVSKKNARLAARWVKRRNMVSARAPYCIECLGPRAWWCHLVHSVPLFTLLIFELRKERID